MLAGPSSLPAGRDRSLPGHRVASLDARVGKDARKHTPAPIGSHHCLQARIDLLHTLAGGHLATNEQSRIAYTQHTIPGMGQLYPADEEICSTRRGVDRRAQLGDAISPSVQ